MTEGPADHTKVGRNATMRRVMESALVVALALLGFWGPKAYQPQKAVRYASRHWRWTRPSGKVGPAFVGSNSIHSRQVPGPGWFQPGFQCAEFVGRSLAAGGIPIPLVGSSSSQWPILVNVDRQSYFLQTTGYATFIPKSRVKVGDVALFRYRNLGHPESPTYWSHMGIVVHVHPLLLDTHNSAHQNILWHQLDGGTIDHGFLGLSNARHRQAYRWHPKPGTTVAVHYRNFPAIGKGPKLYRNQLYRIAASTRWGQFRLQGVPGRYWGVGFVPLSPTSPLLPNGLPVQKIAWPSGRYLPYHPTVGPLAILGLTPHARYLLSGHALPIPPWTGSGALLETRLPQHSTIWMSVSPKAVTFSTATRIHLAPTTISPTLAEAPAASTTVLDAKYTSHGIVWAQVEWWGAHFGIGFVLMSHLRPAPYALRSAPFIVHTPYGAVHLNRGTMLAVDKGRYAYAGAWVP